MKRSSNTTDCNGSYDPCTMIDDEPDIDEQPGANAVDVSPPSSNMIPMIDVNPCEGGITKAYIDNARRTEFERKQLNDNIHGQIERERCVH